MAAQDLKYKDLTQKIIGCAMKVHRYFGPGFPEVVYKRALMIEMQKIGLRFKEEVERDIIYEGKIIHKRRLDLIVADVVLLELKALKEIDKSDINQILNYLRVFNIEVSLLLNFGAPGLFFKRFVHTINADI
jgi:GxxExxY protein